MAGSKLNFYFNNIKSKLKLFVKKPSFVLFYLDRIRKYSDTKSFDAFIVSYPKSGRTWLQKMIIESVRIESKKKFDLVDISILHEHEPNFPYMLSTHAGSSWEEKVNNFEEIKQDDWEKYSHGKNIFLYRDPRDVLVSQFYHIKHRSGYVDFPKSEIIDNKNVGLLKVIHFMNKWMEYSQKNPDVILNMSYDELKVTPYESMKAILKHLEFNVSDNNINKAIENTSLKKMRQNESEDAKSPWATTKGKNNPNSFHSRKGIVGEYKTFFSAKDIIYIDNIIKENLNPLFNY